ncbi:CidA/LrgA family protein [Paenibacillus arenosi]|uniref:CidA/LrgA family protein n=1 Tax=Paenibacillus arenosi TaxID=2774142 RepID=UPI001CDD889F|nr:CidA/LrgA family protein [Paenibacillus arenosi]
MYGLLGFFILALFHLVGVWLQHNGNIPLPGNVIGLLLFLAALYMRLVRLEWVEQAAQFLLKHMLLFFIPYVVGIIAFAPLLGEHWFSILVGIGGSTTAVLLTTAWSARRWKSQPLMDSTQVQQSVSSPTNKREETML